MISNRSDPLTLKLECNHEIFFSGKNGNPLSKIQHGSKTFQHTLAVAEAGIKSVNGINLY